MATAKLLGIYGASGFGREVWDLISRTELSACQIVFVDDSTSKKEAFPSKILTWDAFLALPVKRKAVVIAIADGQIRKKVSDKVHASGISFMHLEAQNAAVSRQATWGQGAILSAFTTITSNAVIGDHFHCNIYSYVAHDCRIGDYVTFAPAVRCNGNIIIHDFAYIGTGAILRQGTPEKPLIIGEGAIIGMGAVVTKDVPAHTTVVGNPAKPLLRN